MQHTIHLSGCQTRNPLPKDCEKYLQLKVLNFLDVEPAIHDPVEPSLTFSPPATTSPKVVGPIRRRRKTTARQGMEDNIYKRYQDVLAEVKNSGDSLNRVVLTCGDVRSSFFKWRWIVEMNTVVSGYYSLLSQQLKTDELSAACKKSYSTDPLTRQHYISAWTDSYFLSTEKTTVRPFVKMK